MAYIEITSSAFLENLEKVQECCKRQFMNLTVVTKFCLSDPRIIALLYGAGVHSIADANMVDFASLPSCLAEKLSKSLIKTRLTDIRTIPSLPPQTRPSKVFVSDEVLIEAIAELPESQRPYTVLIVELGDLRDGFYPADIPSVLTAYPTVPFVGLSANFGCLSGKMPDLKSIEVLSRCAQEFPCRNGGPLVSIGGTVCWPLIESGKIESMATEFRIGEGIFFGYNSSASEPIEGFRHDVFTLYGEIVEVRDKLITKIKYAGHTALGEAKTPKRKQGNRRCAVLDFGILGASMKDLEPLDRGIEIVGQTFDFTIVDITEASASTSASFRTGRHIPFRAMYAASSQALINPFIEKIIK
jgi:predicted amino acid racemase